MTRRALSGLERRQARTAYLFLLPAIAFFALLEYLPLGRLVARSLQSGPRGDTARGLGNYRSAFADDSVRNSFVITLTFAAFTTIGAIVGGLGLAVILNQPLRGRVAFRAAFLVPYFTSIAVVGLLWRNILDPNLGILNRVLNGAGLPTQQWLISQPLATIIVVTLWQQIGYTMVLFLAGLQTIPEMYDEAARIDGATPAQRFWKIKLPLLAPTTLFVSVISVITGLQAFAQAYIITGGGPAAATDLYVFHVFNVAFTGRNFAYASALSILLLFAVLLFTVVQLRIGRKREVVY